MRECKLAKPTYAALVTIHSKDGSVKVSYNGEELKTTEVLTVPLKLWNKSEISSVLTPFKFKDSPSRREDLPDISNQVSVMFSTLIFSLDSLGEEMSDGILIDTISDERFSISVQVVSNELRRLMSNKWVVTDTGSHALGVHLSGELAEVVPDERLPNTYRIKVGEVHTAHIDRLSPDRDELIHKDLWDKGITTNRSPNENRMGGVLGPTTGIHIIEEDVFSNSMVIVGIISQVVRDPLNADRFSTLVLARPMTGTRVESFYMGKAISNCTILNKDGRVFKVSVPTSDVYEWYYAIGSDLQGRALRGAM